MCTRAASRSAPTALTAAPRRNGVLIIEVSDSYQWQMPEQREADPQDVGGRGLLIVDGLSDNWGARPRESGKTVWSHLA